MKNEIEWPYHLIQAFYQVSQVGCLQDEILDMVRESFNALKNSEFRASVILAAETLHRLNCMVITALIVSEGKPYHKKLKSITLDVGDCEIAQQLLHKLKLQDSIKLL